MLIACRLRLLVDCHSKSRYGWSGASINVLCDVGALLYLAHSWWLKWCGEKGHWSAVIALILPVAGYILERVTWIVYSSSSTDMTININWYSSSNSSVLPFWLRVQDVEGGHTLVNLFKLSVYVLSVTGASSAATLLLILCQIWALRGLIGMHNIDDLPMVLRRHPNGGLSVSSLVIGALWRLCMRHAFFATSHSMNLGELQLSAAFIATDEFYFVLAGASLFLNTFGWDIAGLLLCHAFSRASRRENVWRWVAFLQLLETICACISVTVMRRHLMMWATFAPRFIFSAVFLVVGTMCWLYGVADGALMRYKRGVYEHYSRLKRQECAEMNVNVRGSSSSSNQKID